MSGRTRSDYRGHADHPDREGAGRSAEGAARRGQRHPRDAVGAGDVGPGEGSRAAAAHGRGAARTSRSDRVELTPRIAAELDARAAMDALADAIAIVDADWR